MRQTSLLLLLLAASLPAVEIAPGFSIGGYGEAFVRGESRAANSPRHSLTNDLGQTESSIDFSSDAALKAAYSVDRFRLRLDVLVYSQPPFKQPDSPVLLEQAFIDFVQTPNVTWRAGRFQTTWLGWEGFHTPELWRVNHSAAWDWNVQNHSLKPNKPFVSDGVGALLMTEDGRHRAEFYVVNDVLGDGDDTRGTDKATGASFSTVVPQAMRLELGLAYDPRSTNTGPNRGDAHAFAVDLNADITALKDRGWFFAAEAQFHHHPQLTVANERYGNDLILLAMANYAFDPELSATLMVDYVDRGFSAGDNEVLETAVALLTRPHPQVRFNSEIFYWSESADRADSYGLAAVALVSLP